MEPSQLLVADLKQLHLRAFLAHYARVAEDAARTNLSYERYLLALAEQEIAQRDQQRQQRLIRAAHFPVLKELADFDFTAVPTLHKQRVLELAQGRYIPLAEPILMVGNPGLGKTHLATGLALAACRQGYRVRFYTAAGLVNDLLSAQDDHRMARFLQGMLKQQLLVVDELGFIPMSDQGAQLIFQLCSSLHERVALIVTTNLRFADWTQVFGNERLTGALLDRLTCKAHILELVGESYRFRQRLQRRSPDTLSTHPDVMGAGAGAADAGGPAAALGNISAERG